LRPIGAPALAEQVEIKLRAFKCIAELIEKYPTGKVILVELLLIALRLIIEARAPATSSVTNTNANNVTIIQQQIVEQSINQYVSQLPAAPTHTHEHHATAAHPEFCTAHGGRSRAAMRSVHAAAGRSTSAVAAREGERVI
jgi:hypothetical protein